jgi:hypothetical protein
MNMQWLNDDAPAASPPPVPPTNISQRWQQGEDGIDDSVSLSRLSVTLVVTAAIVLVAMTVTIILNGSHQAKPPQKPRPIVTEQPFRPHAPVYPVAPTGTPNETLSPAASQ